MIRSTVLLLLLSIMPALADSFDGVWQGTGDRGKIFRYVIHGKDVSSYYERGGQFVESRDCSYGISRARNSALLLIQECALAGGLLANIGGYRLMAKDANTLHVRYEPEHGPHEDRGDWIRVR